MHRDYIASRLYYFIFWQIVLDLYDLRDIFDTSTACYFYSALPPLMQGIYDSILAFCITIWAVRPLFCDVRTALEMTMKQDDLLTQILCACVLFCHRVLSLKFKYKSTQYLGL